MLYTYEWVDGWIDKQTVKLCCKLHSTRRVYNLDLIKLILKNTTDIIFSWAVAVGLLSPWKTDCFQSVVLLQCVQCWKCFCCAPWLYIICSLRISLMRWKGRGGCSNHCCILLHTPSLPHNFTECPQCKERPHTSGTPLLKSRLSEELWGADLEEEMATHSSVLVWKNPMDRGPSWGTVHVVCKHDWVLVGRSGEVLRCKGENIQLGLIMKKLNNFSAEQQEGLGQCFCPTDNFKKINHLDLKSLYFTTGHCSVSPKTSSPPWSDFLTMPSA